MIGRLRRAPTAAILVYAGVALAASVEAVVVLRLWRADLRVPFNYRGDALFFALMVKTVVDHGWYLTNPQLGAPGVFTLHDFAQAEAFHLAVIKVLSWLSSDWALLFNLYYLAGFPLITLSAFAVLRHFRVAIAPAFVVSLLYAFLPSRLLIGEGHLYLSIFYQVPLGILAALWVAGDDPPILAPGRGRPRLDLRRRRSIATIAIALLLSGTGVYYAFFAAVLIVAAGAWTALERRSPRHALAGLAVAALIVAGLAVQSVPTLLYRRATGANPAVATRQVGESDAYSLRIAPMLLPVRDHRVPALAALKARYDRASGMTGETSATTLGLVGAAGFLVLLWVLIRQKHVAGTRDALSPVLARLNLAALLLAMTGGFSALFALIVSPQIRTYARMHVFIAFLALFQIALLLDRLWRTKRRTAVVLIAAVAFIGLADQTTARMVPPYAERARDYRADRAFVQALEAQLPRGAQIFQLPYLRFPEAGGLPGTKLVDYDPLQPSLHSRALRWSYPAMYGRIDDAWTSAVADEPVPEMVRTLALAGFEGILVDRNGTSDQGGAIIAALTTALGAPSAARGRLAFFDLAAAKARTLAGVPEAERERRRRETLGRPVLRWLDGFSGAEHGPGGAFRWCSGDCTLEISNRTGHEVRVRVSMLISAGNPPAPLLVTGDIWTESLMLDPGGAEIARAFAVPGGRHLIHFRCEGAPVVTARDPRRLVFRIDDAHLRVPEPATDAGP